MSTPPRSRFLFSGPSRSWPTARPDIVGRVAVITRTMDRPLLLRRVCESVLAQTYRNWLMVIINDGGDAEAVEQVLAPYGPAFEGKLQVIHNPVSLGMEAASNAGLRACDSEFAVILDDDDTWHPEFLHESCAVLMDTGNAWMGGVVCHVRLVQERIEGGNILFEKESDYNSWLTAVTLDRILAENHIATCSFMYRRALLDEIGWYNETLPVLGDWEFIIRFLLAAEIGVIPRVLAFYHRRTDLQGASYDNSVYGHTMQVFDAFSRNDALRQAFLKNRELVGLTISIQYRLLDLSRKISDLQNHDYGLEEFKQNTFIHLEKFKEVIFQQIESLRQCLWQHEERISASVEGLLQKELKGMETRLDATMRERLAKLDEVHLWTGILTWPLRAIWRPIRRLALLLVRPER